MVQYQIIQSKILHTIVIKAVCSNALKIRLLTNDFQDGKHTKTLILYQVIDLEILSRYIIFFHFFVVLLQFIG